MDDDETDYDGPIAAMPYTGPVTLLTKAQICTALTLRKTALDDMIRAGRFPRGLNYSERGHAKRWPQHWLDEFMRRKLRDAARAAAVEEQERNAKRKAGQRL